MGCLVKREKSPFWVACWTTQDGRRLKKSTKQTDRKKALEVLLALERAEGMAKSDSLTETRTRKLLGEVLERTTGEQFSHYTAQSWLSEWLDNKRKSSTPNTILRYEGVIKDFIAHLGKRASLTLAAISPKDIRTFRDADVDSGKTPATANLRVKKILNIPFSVALRQGFIQTNPCLAVDALKSTTGEKEVFSMEQVQALLKVASDDWKGAILMGLYTGARLRDIANMHWKSIDLHKPLITYTQGKTGKTVRIPLHPELESHLTNLPSQDDPNAFVFPSLASKSTAGKSGLSMAFTRLMDKAKIKRSAMGNKKGEKGRAVSTLSFHSFRHTFNSLLANSGVSSEIRQELTGHSSAEMNKKYTHHELSPLKKAIESIPFVR